MPDWIAAPLRGMTYLFLWAVVVAWAIAAPVFGIVLSSYLLMHPTQRILVPLAILATIYVTVRGARLLIALGERALNG